MSASLLVLRWTKRSALLSDVSECIQTQKCRHELLGGFQGVSQRWIVFHKFCDEEIVSSLVNFADRAGEGDDFVPRHVSITITVLIQCMLFINVRNTAFQFAFGRVSGLPQGLLGGKQVVRAGKREFRRVWINALNGTFNRELTAPLVSFDRFIKRRQCKTRFSTKVAESIGGIMRC